MKIKNFTVHLKGTKDKKVSFKDLRYDIILRNNIIKDAIKYIESDISDPIHRYSIKILDDNILK